MKKLRFSLILFLALAIIAAVPTMTAEANNNKRWVCHYNATEPWKSKPFQVKVSDWAEWPNGKNHAGHALDFALLSSDDPACDFDEPTPEPTPTDTPTPTPTGTPTPTVPAPPKRQSRPATGLLWLLTNNNQHCLLFAESHPSIERQGALCWPDWYNGSWVAANTPCAARVYDNDTWLCDKYTPWRLPLAELRKLK